jgi:hypothetical protein
MLHRTLGVVVVFGLGIAAVGAEDSPAAAAPLHSASEPSTLALFALGVALLAIAFLRRRSHRPRNRKT